MVKSKSVDFLIFGATGFTGRRVAKALHETCLKQKLSWAIAGRNESALTSVRDEVVGKGAKTAAQPQIRLADAKDPANLAKIFADVRVVINCAGPYLLTGMNVVEACIKANADYVDITGEPGFMDEAALRFDQMAKENSVLVVHACGFDSIPAELGWLSLQQEAVKRGQKISNIESFMSVATEDGRLPVFNSTTFESGALSLRHAKEAHGIREELSAFRGHPKLKRSGASIALHRSPYFEKRTKSWTLLFWGADAAVVRNSQFLLAQKDPATPFPRYHAYLCVGRLFDLVRQVGLGVAAFGLARSKTGAGLLGKYPNLFSLGLFSSAGPSEEGMRQTSFHMDLFATTEPKGNLGLRVSGPEPGYIATPLMVIQAALCVLQERSSLPAGGVFTPAAAYHESTLRQRLESVGIRFDLL